MAEAPQRSPDEISEHNARVEAEYRAAEDAARRTLLETVLKPVGVRYRNCSLDNFQAQDALAIISLNKVRDYAANIVEHVANGDCVTFFGTVGTGKDHLMIGLMRVAAERGIKTVWRNGMDWFGDLRDNIDRERAESLTIRELSEPQILALSDPIPPFGELSQFQASMLFRVIDARYRNCRPTWLTLNVADGNEASARMGAALVDRLRDRGLAVECKWPSYRASRKG